MKFVWDDDEGSESWYVFDSVSLSSFPLLLHIGRKDWRKSIMINYLKNTVSVI